MKRLCLFLFTAVTCASLSSSPVIPSYFGHQLFFPGTPASFSGSSYAFANPASLAMMRKPDLTFAWPGNHIGTNVINRWGLFAAVPNLGFGMNHSAIGANSINDYKVSLGFGNRSFGLGLGYGWSTGNLDFFQRGNIITLGTLIRPDSHVSFGLTGNFLASDGTAEGIADLAIRPLGKKNWTLFGDYSIQTGQRFETGSWKAGTSLILFNGLQLSVAYLRQNQPPAPSSDPSLDQSASQISCAVQLGFGGSSLAVQPQWGSQTGLHNSYSIIIGGNAGDVFGGLKKKTKIVSVILKGEIKYQHDSFWDRSWTLKSLLTMIERAKNDNSVSGLILNISGMGASAEMKWEISEKLKDFRASGKKVIIYFDDADMSTYAFASVSADSLVMDPLGEINLMGIAARKLYLKQTLNKLGVGFDEWRYFKYKSAAEQLSRTNMSEADREQTKEYLDTIYNLLRKKISESRKIDSQKLEALINDSVMFSSAEAMTNRLVDRISHWEAIEDLVPKLVQGKKRIISPEFISDRSAVADHWGEPPVIAIIYALGLCDMDTGINARKLVKDINRAEKDPAIKAVVFRVDSPGGSGLASDIVADAIKKCGAKKPVIVSQGSVAASGGYWLSMYGQQIVSSPITLTGSIGVIGGWLYNLGLKQKLGLTTDFVKTTEHSDLNVGIPLPFLGVLPDRALTDKETKIMERQIRIMYTNFLEKVANARNRKIEEINAIAQGRIWSGVDAQKNQLVDVLGNLDTAISIAKKKAKIPWKNEIKTIELPGIDYWDFKHALSQVAGANLSDNDFIKYLVFRLAQNGNCLVLVPFETVEMK